METLLAPGRFLITFFMDIGNRLFSFNGLLGLGFGFSVAIWMQLRSLAKRQKEVLDPPALEVCRQLAKHLEKSCFGQSDNAAYWTDGADYRAYQNLQKVIARLTAEQARELLKHPEALVSK